MKLLWHRILAMGLTSLGLTILFSWPMAKMATRGIVYTAFENNTGEPLAMIPGDHLQFLYHMWLAQDTFAGPTPLFHNLYEFNTGDDAERRAVTPYYLPFSAIFTVGSLVGGQAFGWNFTIWISLWLTGLFAWALARRYSENECTAGLLALVPLAFPFTWVNLLSGSPTGFAMMWIPVLLYGLDRWASEQSAAGAAWAGAAIFFSEWSDTHVFFFGVLVTPVWVLFAYVAHRGFCRPTRREWLGGLRAAWPLLVFAALAGLKAWALSRGMQETTVAAGRSASEVNLFSVPLCSLWRSGGVAKTFTGFSALLVAAALAILGVIRLRHNRANRAAAALLILLAGMVGVAWLSTGTQNPLGPRFWFALTRLIPPYGMIRQADKIFCLMPIFFMVALALGLLTLPPAASPRGRRFRTLGFCLVLLLLFLPWKARHRPGICLIDAKQGAYAAVAADAKSREVEPRAVILPLWPGDSHLSSLYQHDVSLYRIRMLNGYRPTPRTKYLEEIFAPLESINLGAPTPDQLRLLRDCRIDYLLFHEDAFPDKVSSFPPGATLLNLLNHPSLRLLARDESVWAFRILPDDASLVTAEFPPTKSTDIPRQLPVLFPVRTWNWKNSISNGVGVVAVPDAASSDCILHVAAPMSEAITSRWIRVAGPYTWQWRVRVRGEGTAEFIARSAMRPRAATTSLFALQANDWQWYTLPSPHPHDTDELTADFRMTFGDADIDAVLLTCQSDFPPDAPGETFTLPAMAFFRSGYSDPAAGSVTFLPARNPADEILYSANLPLNPGSHRITLRYDTPAPDGILLGSLRLRIGPAVPNAPSAVIDVLAGQPAVLEMDVPDNRLFRLSFAYSRAAPLTIHSVEITRCEDRP